MTDKNKKDYIKQKAAEPFQQMLGSIFYPSPDNAQNKNISGSEKVASFTLGFEKIAGLGVKPIAPPVRVSHPSLKSITGASQRGSGFGSPIAPFAGPARSHRPLQAMGKVKHGS